MEQEKLHLRGVVAHNCGSHISAARIKACKSGREGAKMRLRELESELSKVRGFDNPKMELEQYATSAHIAAQLAHTMHDGFDDVEGKTICDLGCGTAMLSIACALQDAAHVVGVDGDEEAIQVAERNICDMELARCVELLRADVVQGMPFEDNAFDVVVMNPPFGTKRRGVDMVFLQAAVRLASDTVYSMHKTSTRSFISRKTVSWNAPGEVSNVVPPQRAQRPRTEASQQITDHCRTVNRW